MRQRRFTAPPGLMLMALRGDKGLRGLGKAIAESADISGDVFDAFTDVISRLRSAIDGGLFESAEDRQIAEQMMDTMRRLSFVRNRLLAIKRRGEAQKERAGK